MCVRGACVCAVGRALSFLPALCVAGQTSQWAEEGTQSYVLGLGVYEPGLLTLLLGMSVSLGLRGGQNARDSGVQGWLPAGAQRLPGPWPGVGSSEVRPVCFGGSSPPSCCLAAPLPESLWSGLMSCERFRCWWKWV